MAYGRYAATLVEKGYKVARIEQTETPEMLDERAKREKIPSKNKTIRREVCQMTSKGTRVNTFLDSTNYEGEPLSRSLARCLESPSLTQLLVAST